MSEVVVIVGGWEHECCGEELAVNDIADLGCIPGDGPSGEACLRETHHDNPPERRVRGRVLDIAVTDGAGVRRSIERMPSGRALRGFDPHDDGHLRERFSGDVVQAASDSFLVTVSL